MRALLILVAASLCAGSAAAQTPRLEPLSSFGCLDCSGPELFSSVQALAVSADGRIIVADRSEPRIRIFDARGRVQRTFGRTGAGPGELRLPIGIGAADGALTVYDMTNRQLSRYDTTGAVRGTQLVDGFAVAAAFPSRGGAPLLGLSSFSQADLELRRVSGDSTVRVRSIGAAELPERPGGHFDLAPVAVAADGSFAVGDGIGAYRIARFRADGTPAGTLRRDVQPVRRTPAEIAAITAQRDRNMARVRAMVAAESRRSTPATAPPPVSAVRNYFNMNALAFDEHGRLWVRVERGPDDQSVFDVFDTAGTLLGEVRVAARIREFTLGADMLVAVTLDELDSIRISVWRVTR